MSPEDLLDALESLCVGFTETTLRVQKEMLRSLRTNNTGYNNGILVELRTAHFSLVPVALGFFVEMVCRPVTKKSASFKHTLMLYRSYVAVHEHAKQEYVKLLEANTESLNRLLIAHGGANAIDTEGAVLRIKKKFPITKRNPY